VAYRQQHIHSEIRRQTERDRQIHTYRFADRATYIQLDFTYCNTDNNIHSQTENWTDSGRQTDIETETYTHSNT